MNYVVEGEIIELAGQVVGLHDVREIIRTDYRLNVSQASFLVQIENELKYGFMLFWNQDADKVKKLRLGAFYKFKASVVEKGSTLKIFFLPGITEFKPAKHKSK